MSSAFKKTALRSQVLLFPGFSELLGQATEISAFWLSSGCEGAQNPHIKPTLQNSLISFVYTSLHKAFVA